jgi:electron transfer flavoprotein alpha subunit
MATIICPHHRPQMATVRHRVFEMPEMDTGRQGQIVREGAIMGEAEIASKVGEPG